MRKILIPALVVSTLLAISGCSNQKNVEKDEIEVLPQGEIDWALLYQEEVIFALIYKDIDKAVCNFYKDFLTISPTTALFDFIFLSIDRTGNFEYQVTVEVMPFVGAHDSVGKDRITIGIAPLEENKIIAFEHVESYEIPDHLQSLIKKPLP